MGAFYVIECVYWAKHKYYPRYSEADLIRTAVVKHLKEKGLLDKKGNYL